MGIFRQKKYRIKFLTEKAFANRLNAYLKTYVSGGSKCTNHWDYYGRQSRIEVNSGEGEVAFTAGAGFDSEYERNFRPGNFRDFIGSLYRKMSHSDDTSLFLHAFQILWSDASGIISIKDAVDVLGEPMTAHKILAVHYANCLLPHIKNIKNPCYLEIGAGTGYLGMLLHSLLGGRVIILDIPEVIPFSLLYGKKRFPKATFVLPHEVHDHMFDDPKVEFVFLTPSQASLIPTRIIDIAANTASFGEMLPEQIDIYFKLLRRVVKTEGLFYTTNRVEKWMNISAAPLTDNKERKGIPVRFVDYPWSSKDKDLFFDVSDFHAIVQPQNPMLSRLTRLAPNG